MGFDGLLGNEQLKKNLGNSLKYGHISHFYLISGPEGSGKHTLARLLAAGILCGKPGAPCLQCSVCRKVMGDTHPDLITVDDPEKKTVSVELVRQARAEVFIRPNEAAHKIYLFPRGQDMGIPAQNALLKVLEEPPEYAVFLLLSDNPEKLLPTIRSRGTLLSLRPLPDHILRPALSREFPDAGAEAVDAAIDRSGGYLGQAKALLAQALSLPPQTEQFARSFAARDSLGLVQTLVPMEKWKRDQLIPILEQWAALLEQALACSSGTGSPSAIGRQIAAGRSPGELMQAIAHLQKAAIYAQGNVSPAAVCGYLSWALR